MDSLLSGLFGDQGDETAQRAKADDFVQRVETGDPTQGFSDEEAVRNYSAVANRLSPNELEDAASQALERFSPEQRREFASLLEKHSDVQPGSVNAEDPRQVAHLSSQLQSQSPDGLVGLLGGGSLDSILGGLLGGGQSGTGGGGVVNDLLGGLLGGDKGDSRGSSTASSGGTSDLLNNPIAKAVLAAIAAMAMKKFMGAGGGDASRRPDGLQGGETRRA